MEIRVEVSRIPRKVDFQSCRICRSRKLGEALGIPGRPGHCNLLLGNFDGAVDDKFDKFSASEILRFFFFSLFTAPHTAPIIWIPDRVWPHRITMYPDHVFQRPRCRPDTTPPYRRPRHHHHHHHHPRSRSTMYQSARNFRWSWTPPWKACKGCKARHPPQ